VIATLWPVSDFESLDMAIGVHEAYSSSGDPSDALVRAQRKAIASAPHALAEAHKWAPYVAVSRSWCESGV
jgi:hypothetical protein